MKSSLFRRPLTALLASATAVACASESPTPNPGSGGSSGTAGSAGTAATGGTSGTAGTSGTSGAAGTSGTGAAGAGGSAAGAGGTSAAGGTNPTGGTSGAGAVSGSAGSAGAAATSGAGGDSGSSGSAGASGDSGSGGQGGASGAAGSAGNGGSGGNATTEGPCDIYAEDGAPCVGAYSMVRRLLSTYDGPLYQVRSGSSAMNTGSGGQTHDIGQTPNGFADADAQDAVCANTTCTVSLLYDQSGRGNHLPVAKAGLSNGGEWADEDDFETIADEEEITVGGNRVYTLAMEQRQGYRMNRAGDGVPRGTAAQGIYMLADGTNYGTACCWDFGNVSVNPKEYHTMNTLFFGVAFWGKGEGNGPWFMADYEAGVWAGGTNPGDPGWGDLNSTNRQPNPANPSLRVPFAIGFLKTDPQDWSLRMADLETATQLTTAYQGGLPKPMDNQGAIVLGVGGDNSNNSWGTFFEGAVTAGYPSDEAEDAVMQNVKAAGYVQ
jgi:hypothetical protein